MLAIKNAKRLQTKEEGSFISEEVDGGHFIKLASSIGGAEQRSRATLSFHRRLEVMWRRGRPALGIHVWDE